MARTPRTCRARAMALLPLYRGVDDPAQLRHARERLDLNPSHFERRVFGERLLHLHAQGKVIGR